METTIATITIIYAIIYIISLFSNCTILIKLFMGKSGDPLNKFIFNLTISDLVFLLLSTFDAITFINKKWIFGNITCKIQAMLVESTYTASITTLTLIAIQRYVAVCRPFSNLTFIFLMKSNRFIPGIWLASFITHIPNIFAYQLYPNGVCTNNYWGKTARITFYSLHTFIFFVIPSIITTISHIYIINYLKNNNTVIPHLSYNANTEPNFQLLSYNETKRKGELRRHKQNKRLMKTLSLLTISFFFFWTPFILVRILIYTDISLPQYVWPCTQVLLIMYTAVNPFIYGLCNKIYRNALLVILSRIQSFLTSLHTGPLNMTDINRLSIHVIDNEFEDEGDIQDATYPSSNIPETCQTKTSPPDKYPSTKDYTLSQNQST